MKNMMGLNWDRIIMHQRDIHQCIADLNTVRKPNFVVIDATRILLTNGPSGPGMVREEKTVIVSTDPIAADAYAATLFRQKPRDIRQLKYAYEMGLGEINTDKMKIRMLNLA
jgi:uncharacterized protein (DUF362 family)